MDNILQTFRAIYQDIFYSVGDPRTRNWYGIASPWLTIVSMAIYLILILKVLPNHMKHKEAYSFRMVLVVYNLILSVYSLLTFIMLGASGWFWNLEHYQCFPQDFSVTPTSSTMLIAGWFFWLSKYVELLDTVFFVLRKKLNQVTVLHIYHHCSMLFNIWIALKLNGAGHFTFVGFTNSFVHTIMYGYYGLAAIGPHMQKYLGWKKYVTKIQLIQFVLNICHAGQVLFNNCKVSRSLTIISLLQCFIFLILFLNFYIRTYIVKKSHSVQTPYKNGAVHNGTDYNANGVTPMLRKRPMKE